MPKPHPAEEADDSFVRLAEGGFDAVAAKPEAAEAPATSATMEGMEMPEAIAEAEQKLTANTERLSANLSKPETPKSPNTWQTIEEKWKQGKNAARNAFFGLMGASAVGLGGTILLNESLPSASDAFTSGLSPDRFEFLSNLASQATTGEGMLMAATAAVPLLMLAYSKIAKMSRERSAYRAA